MRLTVHVDGGSRGNPGPAAAGAIVTDAGGEVLDRSGELIGETSNNVAEYRGLLLGISRARELGATEVEIFNDSELVAHQVNGRYKVKHADMKPLHAEALEALSRFDSWSLTPVRREQNVEADAIVNETLDAL